MCNFHVKRSIKGYIQRDMQAIEQIYGELVQYPIEFEAKQDRLIVTAYYLHNLYNAFENIFKNIATTFENSMDSSAGWRSQLLEQMELDLMPLRPAVIDQTTAPALDELRRFRHVFRHAYLLQLDVRRLQLVWESAINLQVWYRLQLEKFMQFLDDVR